MPELVFVLAPGQNAFFVELASALRQELLSLGVGASLHTGAFPEPRPDRVFVLVPPHEYAELREGDVPRRLLPRTIFICAEQPGTPWFGSNLRLTRRGGAVMDVNRASVRLMRRVGIRADHLPLGYTPTWDRFDSGGECDVDLLFMASMTERREAILAAWADRLWRRRTRLVISDNTRPNAATSQSFVAGDDKLALVARSKVLLNLHRTTEPYFEWQRALDAIHCGAVLVTEPSTDYEPLAPGDHFLAGHPETLPVLAEELIEDEDRRRAMARGAYELIRERLPLRASAEKLAAVAESLAARPARLSLLSGLRGRERFVGPEPSLGSVLSPLIDRIEAPSRAMLGGVKDARLAMVALSRRVERVERSIERGRPPPPVEVVLETSAHRAAEAPRVSVITALYNQVEHVQGALESVIRGRFRDFELIVVDDGSTDGSAGTVRDWMKNRDSVPGLLLRHPVNRGLPATRNTAIDFAHGELVLVLDADNEIYPHCLERLTEALDADPDAAFAYGLLQTFDGHGPRGVIGYLGWEPDRLRRWNYIDALALVRRSVLREVGGYTTDLRLHGWEDYDLWCKLASQGLRGHHLKEIVARYRVSPGSMISLTNLSLEGAEAALAERHPGLFETVRPAASADYHRRAADRGAITPERGAP